MTTTTEQLPPLPEPREGSLHPVDTARFDSHQLREAQRAAIAADRASRTAGWEVVAWCALTGNGQMDDIVRGHVLLETASVSWCSVNQEWATNNAIELRAAK